MPQVQSAHNAEGENGISQINAGMDATGSQTRTRPQSPPRFQKPSSSTDGFFQAAPYVLSQIDDDLAMRRALKLFLPTDASAELTPELSSFSRLVLTPKVMTWINDAEKNLPYVKHWDSYGKRRDVLITSEGWRNLQALGIAEGIVAIPYENRLDPEYAWITGQWMTERAGGSDVSQTETLATYCPDAATLDDEAIAADGNPLGPWKLDGFKWFSSATDADMVVMLARTSKGISTFFAPMRKTVAAPARDALGSETELNGISIQRLKNKLGTKALPTAELVLQGTRGYLIGEEGRGTREIATVLNIARIHNEFTAIGLWGRGISIVRAFGRVRSVGRTSLLEKTAYVATLARMHVEYRTNVLFNYFVAGLIGVVEQKQAQDFRSVNGGDSVKLESIGNLPGLRDVEMAEHLLRLLTPALKGVTAKTSVAGLSECLECCGGVGYLENDDQAYNIARLYRDANVLSIWEGTTDMMAHDVLRVVYGKTKDAVFAALSQWLDGVLTVDGQYQDQKAIIRGWWSAWKAFVERAEKGEVEMRARRVMEKLADIVQGALLIADAQSDGDEIAGDVLNAWLEQRVSETVFKQERGVDAWKTEAARNMRAVFGSTDAFSARSKL